MAYENIILNTEGNVAIIKINRPKALNAINPGVLRDINDALDVIEADSGIKVLIITGEGDKAFVAGADIGHMANFTPLQGRQFSMMRWPQIVASIAIALAANHWAWGQRQGQQPLRPDEPVQDRAIAPSRFSETKVATLPPIVSKSNSASRVSNSSSAVTSKRLSDAL